MNKQKKQQAAFKGIYFNESAKEVAMLIKKHTRVMGLTMGQFSLIDLIHEILKIIGPSHVITATWSAGIRDIRTIKWLQDSNLVQSFKFIVDHSYVTRKKEYIVEINDIVGIDNIYTSEIHAKFVLIENHATKIIIRTSMNLNANRTCESFEIDECDDIYDFYKQFANKIINISTSGFIASSAAVNKNIKKVFQQSINPNKWQSDVQSIQFH